MSKKQRKHTAPRQHRSKPLLAAEPRRPGRPGGQGKRLNPAYVQVTAYIPAKLHMETKINLLRLPQKKEFSELVAELLVAWNKKKPRI